jgi:hypothetical protein
MTNDDKGAALGGNTAIDKECALGGGGQSKDNSGGGGGGGARGGGAKGVIGAAKEKRARANDVEEGGGDQRRNREGNCPSRGISLHLHRLKPFWGGMHLQQWRLGGHE